MRRPAANEHTWQKVGRCAWRLMDDCRGGSVWGQGCVAVSPSSQRGTGPDSQLAQFTANYRYLADYQRLHERGRKTAMSNRQHCYQGSQETRSNQEQKFIGGTTEGWFSIWLSGVGTSKEVFWTLPAPSLSLSLHECHWSPLIRGDKGFLDWVEEIIQNVVKMGDIF